jgi:hypothetical protein
MPALFAGEAFVTNSNVGLVPVVQIDEQVLPIGRETLEIALWLVAASEARQSTHAPATSWPSQRARSQ